MKLKVKGKAMVTGPASGKLKDEALKLPAWGFVYLESDKALKVAMG